MRILGITPILENIGKSLKTSQFNVMTFEKKHDFLVKPKGMVSNLTKKKPGLYVKKGQDKLIDFFYVPAVESTTINALYNAMFNMPSTSL